MVDVTRRAEPLPDTIPVSPGVVRGRIAGVDSVQPAGTPVAWLEDEKRFAIAEDGGAGVLAAALPRRRRSCLVRLSPAVASSASDDVGADAPGVLG